MLLIERLRALLKKSSMGMDRIAQETGLDRDLLAKFVAGEMEIPLAVAEDRAGCLGVQLGRADATVRREWLRHGSSQQKKEAGNPAIPILAFETKVRTYLNGGAGEHESN